MLLTLFPIYIGWCTFRYDVAVIGGGPGGYVSAIRLSNHGLRVALIEKGFLGGECTNWGCIPSKALISISEFLREAKTARKYGIINEIPKISYPKVMRWVKQAIRRSRVGVGHLLEDVDIFRGRGIIKAVNRVSIMDGEDRGKIIEADNVIVATGTEPKDVPGLRFDGERVISNRELFELDDLPSSVLVVGGGAVGTEIASALASLGVETSLVEALDRILPSQDPDISSVVEKHLRKEGVGVMTSSAVKVAGRDGEGIKVRIIKEGKVKEISVDKVLIAAGRKYNTEGIGLEEVGVRLREDGSVKVDSFNRTSVPSIYAVGDITGPPLLAHKAFREAIVAADTLMFGKPKHVLGPVPMIIFCRPEVGSVGMSELEVRNKGIPYKTFKYPFAAVPREFTRLNRNPDGFAKLIIGEDGKLLGASVVGDGASELIHIFALAMGAGLTVKDLLRVVYAHPTISEVVGEIAHLALGEPVHAERSWLNNY